LRGRRFVGSGLLTAQRFFAPLRETGLATGARSGQRLCLGFLLELDLDPKVALYPFAGQLHVTLPFRETTLLFFRVLVVAVMAADTLDEVFGFLVFGAQRHAACAAEFVFARFQSMTHGHALVEHEAIALPEALLFGHGLKILEDAALQVIDLVV